MKTSSLGVTIAEKGAARDACPALRRKSAPVKLALDDLVTTVASDLMGVTAPTLHEASERLLHQLVDYFEVDLSFLRRNDHEIAATVLVAEWPVRPVIPVPDPLGVVLFATAEPEFAALETLDTV